MNLLKAASTVSLLTLASRVTGLAREWIVATQFGASAWTDAFNVAFRIPNLLRRLFAEGAFSQAFVPILGDVKEREGDEATRSLVNAVATVLLSALVLTCILGVAGAPLTVWLMASGLAELDEAVLMTRLMFPYIGFMALVALAAGVLNTYRHFVVPAATPVLLNLCVIGAALGASPQMERVGLHPIYALCLGVMVGGVLQPLLSEDEVLNLSIRRGTLNDDDRWIINKHINDTQAMLKRLPFPPHLTNVPEIAGNHHEKMDGTGYPNKLRKEDMSLTSRMMGIADIFEALTAADRPYKKPKTLSESIKIMSFMRKDQHIDPELFELFLRSGVYKQYAERFLLEEQIDEVNIEPYLVDSKNLMQRSEAKAPPNQAAE